MTKERNERRKKRKRRGKRRMRENNGQAGKEKNIERLIKGK